VFNRNKENVISVDYLEESDGDTSAYFRVIYNQNSLVENKICKVAKRNVLRFRCGVNATGALLVFYVA
jgi:hypothetical protein